jgi:hypothetical protein
MLLAARHLILFSYFTNSKNCTILSLQPSSTRSNRSLNVYQCMQNRKMNFWVSRPSNNSHKKSKQIIAAKATVRLLFSKQPASIVIKRKRQSSHASLIADKWNAWQLIWYFFAVKWSISTNPILPSHNHLDYRMNKKQTPKHLFWRPQSVSHEKRIRKLHHWTKTILQAVWLCDRGVFKFQDEKWLHEMRSV